MQGWFNIQRPINIIHIIKLKKKKHMNISIDALKIFIKSTSVLGEKNKQTSQQTRRSWEHLNQMKEISEKLSAYNIFSGKIPNAFPLSSGIRQGCLPSSFLHDILQVLDNELSRKEEVIAPFTINKPTIFLKRANILTKKHNIKLIPPWLN